MTCFFAAAESDVTQALVEHGPPYPWEFPSVGAKNLSEVSIASLAEMLGLGLGDDIVARIPLVFVGKDDDAKWEDGIYYAGIFAIPDELRDALAAIDDVQAIADRWLVEMGWRADEALATLTDLRELTRGAQAEALRLWYFWML